MDVSELALPYPLLQSHLMREDGLAQDLPLRIPHLSIVITCRERERAHWSIIER